ncbi:3-oxoacyl-ACP reductase FabG [Thiohalomonas denitrificans]|uniref:3-oxoacyl-ACP reductase FabG n=1 Tax=Thiohalomonas denitrificans TaxID=415747 RepID=UPI0026EFCE9F|nr:3-oxoacyl-ACP reductase FabG [Thiohalomonas denitrificans]
MKRALVTGGSGSIGSAICRRLAEQRLHVLVHANSRPEAADAVVEEIREAGGSAEAIGFDVCDTESARIRLQAALESGPIQVVINNAGIHDDALLAGMSPEQWRRVVDVSLNGFYSVTQPLLLPMARTRWGRIISLSSVAGVLGNRGQANYAAAKAGVQGATKSLALELASRGITANVVAPGVITSPMTEDLFPPERIKQIVPMQRAGTPEEVADLVAFLASNRAGYISGQIISINGAMG